MANAGGAAPALVNDEERVARLCYRAEYPITRRNEHLSDLNPDTDSYRLEEFTWDDFTKNGFSVQRISLFSRGAANAALQERIAKKKAKADPAADTLELVGAVLASVAEVHAIRTLNGNRAFVVCEEPIEGNPAHACIRSEGSYPKGEFLKYRVSLQAAFGQARSLEVFPETV